MYRFYASPQSLDEALALKAEHSAAARIIAGGTDLLIEMDRGVRSGPHQDGLGIIDITRIAGLAEIVADTTMLHLGPLVTHNQCVASPLVLRHASPLAQACWEVGAPQIRNRATVAGNVITASPANDTIAPLLALDADVTVVSAARGERRMPLRNFITGFRRVDLADDEILTRISIPLLGDDEAGAFIKLGLRRAQAVSVVNAAAVLQRDVNRNGMVITRARLALGAVAPIVVRASAAEEYLHGKELTDAVIAQAATLAQAAATPIDDIRATAAYRHAMVATLVTRLLRAVREGQSGTYLPDAPVMLWGETGGVWPVRASAAAGTSGDSATVNGREVALPGGMTLLDSLRTAGFVGVKEGCAEGECGACTVFLDGMAVMACVVPAERAYGSQVVTVEGLGDAARLHPVQAALAQTGGVQCGYCTPGFVMSAAKLLEERPMPTLAEAQEALTGNFCRCTGYRKILDAVVAAGAQDAEVGDAG